MGSNTFLMTSLFYLILDILCLVCIYRISKRKLQNVKIKNDMNMKDEKRDRVQELTDKYEKQTEKQYTKQVKTERSESQIQSACVMWLWNTHPETRGLFFSVTNNSEHIARAMQRRAVGLVPGVSDCLFIWGGRTYCFEFKTPTGRQSPAQIEWQHKVERQGMDYYIIRSLEQFQLNMSEILRVSEIWFKQDKV